MEGYDTAISMCGNDGQVSIIEMTEPGFNEAALEAMYQGDPLGPLVSACPYPEAVGEILEEAAMAMYDAAEDRMGKVWDMEPPDEGEDAWDYDPDDDMGWDW